MENVDPLCAGSGRVDIPVPYFHLVFTLPAELLEVVCSNQKALYAVLFRGYGVSIGYGVRT